MISPSDPMACCPCEWRFQIMARGTDEQKQRWLPAMASGQHRGALSLSEPDAGSDTRNISCHAARGDEYVINGTKAWVTNGERAGIVALAARTEEGISAFIVEKEPGTVFEGISVGKHVGKLGYRGVETVEMAYTDHRIPAANLVGDAGHGLSQILGVLEIGDLAPRSVTARSAGGSRPSGYGSRDRPGEAIMTAGRQSPRRRRVVHRDGRGFEPEVVDL
jgi:alkylation response protein AidB-like acyl-CoA dehydrogenase